MLIPADENHFTVNVDVHVSKQFLGWVFSLGEQVKILSPEEVVEQMQGEVKRLVEQYDSESRFENLSIYEYKRSIVQNISLSIFGKTTICI